MCVQRLRRNRELGVPGAGVLNEITVAGQRSQGGSVSCSGAASVNPLNTVFAEQGCLTRPP